MAEDVTGNNTATGEQQTAAPTNNFRAEIQNLGGFYFGYQENSYGREPVWMDSDSNPVKYEQVQEELSKPEYGFQNQLEDGQSLPDLINTTIADTETAFRESTTVLDALHVVNGNLNAFTKDVGVVTAPFSSAQGVVSGAQSMLDSMKSGDFVGVVQGAARTMKAIEKTAETAVTAWTRINELNEQFKVTETLKSVGEVTGLNGAVEGDDIVVLEGADMAVVGVADPEVPDRVVFGDGTVVDSNDSVAFAGEHDGFVYTDDGQLLHVDHGNINLLESPPDGFVVPDADFEVMAGDYRMQASEGRIAAGLLTQAKEQGIDPQQNPEAFTEFANNTLAEGASEVIASEGASEVAKAGATEIAEQISANLVEDVAVDAVETVVEEVGEEAVSTVVEDAAGSMSVSATVDNVVNLGLKAVGYKRGEHPELDVVIDGTEAVGAWTEAIAEGGVNLRADWEAAKKTFSAVEDIGAVFKKHGKGSEDEVVRDAVDEGVNPATLSDDQQALVRDAVEEQVVYPDNPSEAQLAMIQQLDRIAENGYALEAADVNYLVGNADRIQSIAQNNVGGMDVMQGMLEDMGIEVLQDQHMLLGTYDEYAMGRDAELVNDPNNPWNRHANAAGSLKGLSRQISAADSADGDPSHGLSSEDVDPNRVVEPSIIQNL